jgi:hypothetical protein
VLYGRSVTLSGRLVNGAGGQHLTIMAKPYGRSSAVKLVTISTGPKGRFTVHVDPTIQTTYQARFGDAQSSSPITVGVAPAITTQELQNGILKAHVQATPTLRGKMVQLQVRKGGHVWQTIAKRPLGSDSTATFNLTRLALSHSTVRVAMSVNQAGAGYLGTVTHPFLYRAL